MPLSRRLRAACALVLALLGAPAGALAAETPPAVTIVDPAGDITVDAGGQARVIVRNDAAEHATPHVEVVGDDGTAIPSQTDAKDLAPGAAGPVTITVTGHPQLSGHAIVTLPGTGARAAVAKIAATAAPAATVHGEPDQVQVDLVRHCLIPSGWFRRTLCGGATSSRVWIGGIPRATVRAQTIRGLGSGEGGQSAVAVLRPAKPGRDADALGGPPTPLFPAEAWADATAVGDYKPVLTLDPAAEKPTQITVAVRARDWVLWAMLVLSLGALAGWWLHDRYEARRARRELELRLARLSESYKNAERHAADGMPPLRPLFGDRGTTDAPGFDDLYARVQGCRSTKDVTGIAPEVVTAEGDLDRWLAVDRGMRALATALRSVDAGNRERRGDPLIDDTVAQLAGVSVPDDAAAAEKLAVALESQAALVKPYIKVRRLFDAHQGGADLNPAELYKKRFAATAPAGTRTPIADRTPGAVRALALALAAAATTLQHKPPRTTRVAEALEPDGVAGIATFDLIDALPPVLALGGAPAVPSAAALEREIVRTDRWVFLATFVIVVTTYVATLYSGKAWGSLEDYLAAFAAGFGGQALAGVALAPFLRAAIGRGAPAAPAKDA